MGPEIFTVKGLMITEYNFLQVYPYIKWSESHIPYFQEGDIITTTECMLNSHFTQAPPLLSESDLISLMDKAGIGTDATIHQHIKTIQDRNYAFKNS